MTAPCELRDAAVDIGGTTWLAGVPGNDGVDVVGSGSTGEGPQTVVNRIVGALGVNRPRALGCSFAGEIDRTGVVAAWPNRPSWTGFPLRERLSSALGLTEIAVRDDGYAAALGEARMGVARDVPDHLTMTLGTGIGAALVIDGRPRQPRGPGARTLGHLRALGRDRACRCGGRGCLQLALETLPAGGQNELYWPDGLRLVEVITDLVGGIGVATIVVGGGLAHRDDVTLFLTTEFGRAGVLCRIPARPAHSSLLGALVQDGG